MSRFCRVFPIIFCLLCTRAYGSISLITVPSLLGANDTAVWSQLGADQATIPHSFAATSAGGLAITGTFATSTGQVAVTCPATPTCSWTTSGTGIAAGDSLIWTIDPNANPGNDGPLTLAFPSVFGAGAWIQADEASPVGAFTAQIQAFKGATSLGTVSETSNTNGDPIFIGVKDSLAEISSLTFSLTAVPANSSNNDFALDTLLLETTAPEPDSLVLLALGLMVIAGARLTSGRRK